MKESWLELLVEKYHENRFAHAFLFETNNNDLFLKDFYTLLKILNCPSDYDIDCKKDCNICQLIDNLTLPSLIFVHPDGSTIKKEQINEIMQKFSTKPIFSKYNIYVIFEADRLNGAAANSILKFLEEPADDIIGFFVTNNRENVLSTIRSRCQVINAHYSEDSFSYNEEVLDEVKIYLNAIYKSSNDLLYNKTNMSGKYSERGDWEIFFKTMMFYFLDSLGNKNDQQLEIMNNISSKNKANIINFIKNILEYIKFNGNIDLILDKFVIEMRKFYE